MFYFAFVAKQTKFKATGNRFSAAEGGGRGAGDSIARPDAIFSDSWEEGDDV